MKNIFFLGETSYKMSPEGVKLTESINEKIKYLIKNSNILNSEQAIDEFFLPHLQQIEKELEKRIES